MVKYIIDKDKTLDLHYALQDMMFEHCDDFEILPFDDWHEEETHCKKCPYYLACKISNEISFRISMNRW